MAYESLLEKITKGKTIRCPGCGSEKMKFMPHLNMYGGYVCSGCSKIWSENHPKIKEQKKKVL